MFFGLVLQVNKTIFKADYYENNEKLYHLKTSSAIAFEWNQTWGGVDFDFGWGIALDSARNIYVTGTTMSYGAGAEDLFLVKFDSSGGYQWNRTWGEIDTDIGSEVAVDSLDNVYIVGSTENFGSGNFDIVLVKYDNLGVQQWNLTWGGTGFETGRALMIDSLDNVYIVGDTDSFGAGEDDLVLIKFNSSGGYQWYRTWGGSDKEVGNEITMDSLGNIYVTGYNGSTGLIPSDMVLVKFDSFGIEQWNITRNEREHDVGNGVAVDSLDDVYVVGSMVNLVSSLDRDIFLVKYNSSGSLQWNQTWGGNDMDSGAEVVVDSLNNIYVVGDSFGAGLVDTVLIKYDISGTQKWYKTWGEEWYDYATGLTLDSSDSIYISGATDSFGPGHYDVFILKYSEQGETAIPGFDPLIVVGIASMVIIINLPILYWRKKRN